MAAEPDPTRRTNEARRESGAICYVALGSNLGDRAGHLTAATWALAAHLDLEITATAGLYQTAPVGGPRGQRPYLNTVLAVWTDLAPQEVLQACLATEGHLGRRRAEPNDPRTIDIDLLLYGEYVCDGPDLILPHPRMHLRRFVLTPLAEIAADVVHPVLQRSIGQLLADLAPAEVTGEHCIQITGQDWSSTSTCGPVCPG